MATILINRLASPEGRDIRDDFPLEVSIPTWNWISTCSAKGESKRVTLLQLPLWAMRVEIQIDELHECISPSDWEATAFSVGAAFFP